MAKCSLLFAYCHICSINSVQCAYVTHSQQVPCAMFACASYVIYIPGKDFCQIFTFQQEICSILDSYLTSEVIHTYIYLFIHSFIHSLLIYCEVTSYMLFIVMYNVLLFNLQLLRSVFKNSFRVCMTTYVPLHTLSRS